MNNFKKIGLTALAGSLALISVAQAEVVLSGSSEATYTTSDESSTGNPIGYSNDFNIDASGEFNNGWTYTTHLNFAGQNMGADSNSLVIGMGDLGSIGIDQGVELFGISGMSNFGNPSAYEEADHGVSSLDDTLDGNASGVIGYNGSFAGVSLSLEYQPTTTGVTQEAGTFQGAGETASNINFMVSSAVPMVDGLTVAFGHSKDSNDVAGTVEDQELTYGARYTFSNVTVGYQVIETQSGTAATAGNNGETYGIAVNVNENFSVSYNVADMEVDNVGVAAVNVTEESTGISAAYSMGSASVRFSYNEADNVGGVAGAKDDNTEISLALAF
jgi:outer membrane protein OmpU